MQRGAELGGVPLQYGDASVRVRPLPKVPAVMILWVEDEEFGPRTELLFDSSCEGQLPIDVIWAVAMMSVIAFL